MILHPSKPRYLYLESGLTTHFASPGASLGWYRISPSPLGFLMANSGVSLRAELLSIGTDPLFGRSFLVDLVEFLLIGSSLVCGFAGGGREEVTSDDTKVAEEFAEFRVGDEEGDEHSQVGSGWKSPKKKGTALITLP